MFVAAGVGIASPMVSTPPRPIGGLISDRDYPPHALRREAQGQTRARLLIASDGRVTRCQVAKSSGHEDLDRRVCDLAVTRMQFSPALDAAGRPVAVEVILPVTWLVGDASVAIEPSAH